MPLFEPAKVKNLGIFARIDRSYAAIGSVTIPVANGLKVHDLNASSATFTASITTTTMTVTVMASGTIKVGQTVTGGGTTAGTIITQQLTGTIGGVGTYQVSISQTRASGSKSSSITTTATNFNILPTAGAITENFQTTNYITPGGDCYTFNNGLVLPSYLNNKYVEVSYGLEVLLPTDAMIVPLLHNGYTSPDSFVYADVNGSPKLIQGFGYGGSFESNANDWHWVTHNFIYKGFIENMGGIGIYRNIHGIGDALSINASVRKYFIQIKQLEV